MPFSLHIDTAISWRGGQSQVLQTVMGLRARGHEPVRRAADAKRSVVAERLVLAQAFTDGRAQLVPDPWSAKSHGAQSARAERGGQTAGARSMLWVTEANGAHTGRDDP